MAKEERIVSYTLDQIKEMVARGEDRTDWAAVDRKTEAELEMDIASDPDADIGEPTDRWIRVPEGYEVKVVKKSA